MTGAGTASLGWLHEPTGDYMGSPSDSTYKRAGKNPSIEDLSFDNALSRLRLQDDPQIADAVATNFEGAFGISFVPTNPWFFNHVFGQPPTAGGESSAPYSYTWTFTSGRVQSSRWYVGLDYLDGIAERVLEGVVFGGCSLEVSQGDPVRYSLTGFYGDEKTNTSITPGSIQGDEEPLIYHGGDLTIDGTTQAKIESASLEVNPNSRAQRDWSRHPADAVIGNVETTMTLTDIVTSTQQLELAYGGAGATSVQDSVGEVSATLDLLTPGDHAHKWALSGVTPGTYGWQQLMASEEDTMENVTYTVADASVTAESSESSAL